MKYWKIQLFRVRLSYERGKAYATMSKVAIGNGGFTVAWLNLMEFQRGGRKQPKHAFPCFFLPCRWITLKLIQSSKALTITTHNTNQHCRARFYVFVGPLSQQLYITVMYQSIPNPPGQSPGIWLVLSSVQRGIWPKMRPTRWGIKRLSAVGNKRIS